MKEKKAEKAEETENSNVKIINLKSFTYNGEKYGRDANNKVYDLKTRKIIGTWNIERKKIELSAIEEDEEDEEEEEEEGEEEEEEEAEDEEEEEAEDEKNVDVECEEEEYDD